MANIQVRIHRDWCDVSGFILSCFDKCAKGFVFQHPQDEEVARTHVHAYFFGYMFKRESLSESIAKKLNLKGNTDFFTSENCSRKDPRPIDISGSFEYGSKWDSIAPIFQKNISPVQMEQLRSYARKNGTFHKVARGSHTTEQIILKEIKVKTKPTQYQHAKTCATRIMEKHPEVLIDNPNQRVQNMNNIFEIAYAYFRESELYMGKYKQLDFLDMVLVIINSADYRNQLRNAFLKRHEISQYNV